MNKIKQASLFTLGIIFFFTLSISNAVAGEVKIHTGTIADISLNRIELDRKGSLSMIGFLCEPEVCETTKNFKTGDEVIVDFGSVNRKNKLLLIQKCSNAPERCAVAKQAERMQDAELAERIALLKEGRLQCNTKIDEELSVQGLLFPDLSQLVNDNSIEEASEKYNFLVKQTTSGNCLKIFLQTYRDAFFEACSKHNCGKNIGGGCYHMTGYSITPDVTTAAVKKCDIH